MIRKHTAVLTLCAAAALASASPEQAQRAELLSDASERISLNNPEEFPIRVSLLSRFTYSYNYRRDSDLDNNSTGGFRAHLNRIGFRGKIDDNIELRLLLDADADGGEVEILEAFGVFKLSDEFTLNVGQKKLPFTREQLNSSAELTAVERSLVNRVFSQGRSQMVEGVYTQHDSRFMAAFSDGRRATNKDIGDPDTADWAFTGRVEQKFGEGGFSRYSGYSSWRGSGFGALLGAAGHYQSGGDTGRTDDLDLGAATADLTLKGDGWALAGVFAWQNVDRDGSSFNDFGVTALASYFIEEQWEVFGRYDGIFADSGRENSGDFNAITAGFTHYFIPQSHALKFTVDAQWFLDRQEGSLLSPNNSQGLLASDRADQFNVRAAIQFLY
ncbi:MAG: hypothetical protein JJU33_02450 [Phycisphaerales bacterium]|nr:hypothetical protein [Phycisphaerales bacterium]